MSSFTAMSLDPSKFKALIKKKGWTLRAVAERWGITDVWMYNIAGNAERAKHYDDALFGLPSKANAVRQGKRRSNMAGKFTEEGCLFLPGELVTTVRYIGSIAEEGDSGRISAVDLSGRSPRYLLEFDRGSDWFGEDAMCELVAQKGIVE